jgi:high-affinity nickel-transport protein
MNGGEIGLVVAAALYGFRHGFDLDHLAALSDITGSTSDRRSALSLSTLYVIGHASVVLVLGVAAIAAGAYIPRSLDDAMGRVIGVTLIALGLYLAYSVVRHGSAVRFRSRWMLAADGVRAASKRFRRKPETVVIEHSHEHAHDRTHEHLHEEISAPTNERERGPLRVEAKHSHAHTHVATMPVDPLRAYSARAALGVGMIHGIGAETPTQVLLFASAAGAGTALGGGVVLVSFLVGLVLSNSLVAVLSTFGLAERERFPRVYVAMAIAVAAFSLFLGITYLTGGDVSIGAVAR